MYVLLVKASVLVAKLAKQLVGSGLTAESIATLRLSQNKADYL